MHYPKTEMAPACPASAQHCSRFRERRGGRFGLCCGGEPAFRHTGRRFRGAACFRARCASRAPLRTLCRRGDRPRHRGAAGLAGGAAGRPLPGRGAILAVGADPAFGYYSKPPLVAWLIARPPALFGDSEFAVRAGGAAAARRGGRVCLRHRRAAVRPAYRVLGGARLCEHARGLAFGLHDFDRRGIAAVLGGGALCLYPRPRARRRRLVVCRRDRGRARPLGEIRNGVLAAVGARLFVCWCAASGGICRALSAPRRWHWLIYAPNAWWNWTHGFVSYRHLGDNAHLAGALFHPRAFAEFFLSQFGVFGPVLFALLLAVASHPRVLAEPRSRLLAVFSLPTWR